jgi:hypothetical protein
MIWPENCVASSKKDSLSASKNDFLCINRAVTIRWQLIQDHPHVGNAIIFLFEPQSRPNQYSSLVTATYINQSFEIVTSKAGLISCSIVNALNMTKQRALCIPHAELANHAERKKQLLPLDQASMPGSQVLWRVARSLLVLGSETENSSQNKKEHINHHGRTIQIIICQTHPWWVQPSLCFRCKGWKLLGPSNWVIVLYLRTHFFLTVCTLSSYQDLIISRKQLGLTDWVASA